MLLNSNLASSKMDGSVQTLSLLSLYLLLGPISADLMSPTAIAIK